MNAHAAGAASRADLSLIPSPWLALFYFAIAALAAALVLRMSSAARASLVSDEAGRLRSVDSMRGLAAVGVFVHHVAVTWIFLERGRWVGPPSRLFEHLGESSVALFFMVTALLFWERVIAGKPVDWFRFLTLRVYRLYPAHLVVLALLLVLVFFSTGGRLHQPPADLTRALASWLIFCINGFPDINGQEDTGGMIAYVSWSLRYEWLFTYACH